MWFTTLLSRSGKVVSKPERRLPPGKRRVSYRPSLEGLEERTVPSYVFTTIDVPNGSNNAAWGINSRGDVVGSYTDAFAGHGFLLSQGQYTNIDAPNAISTLAVGINSRGNVVGIYADASFVSHGFLLSGGQYTTIDPPSAGFPGAVATGINASGSIVGSYIDTNGVNHGFLFSGGQYTTLDDPDGVYGTITNGINAAGQIVGFYFDANFGIHGFLLSHGQYTTLDNPNATFGSGALGINDHGQIVGGYFDANSTEHGFLLSGGQYTTIDNPNGAIGTETDGINNSGQIVGPYYDVTGHAFLATPAHGASVLSGPRVATGLSGSIGSDGRMEHGQSMNSISLAHTRIQTQARIAAIRSGAVLGHGLGHTIPVPSTITITAPTGNINATSMESQGMGTRTILAAAPASKNHHTNVDQVFARKDNPFDPGFVV